MPASRKADTSTAHLEASQTPTISHRPTHSSTTFSQHTVRLRACADGKELYLHPSPSIDPSFQNKNKQQQSSKLLPKMIDGDPKEEGQPNTLRVSQNSRFLGSPNNVVHDPFNSPPRGRNDDEVWLFVRAAGYVYVLKWGGVWLHSMLSAIGVLVSLTCTLYT